MSQCFLSIQCIKSQLFWNPLTFTIWTKSEIHTGLELHWMSKIWQKNIIFKDIVHKKRENSAINHSPSCHFKPIRLHDPFKIFFMKSERFLPPPHILICVLKNQIKSNLFIVKYNVHKCTDGEILRYKTLCHGSTSSKIWKMYNIQTTIYTLYTIYTFTRYAINNRQLYTIYNTHVSIIYTW